MSAAQHHRSTHIRIAVLSDAKNEGGVGYVTARKAEATIAKSKETT